MKTIMFTGHRNCSTDEIFLENIASLYDECVWIHGGAIGFDSQVKQIAAKHRIQTKVYKPDYKNNNPKSAPIIRNREMLKVCDVVVACYDGREKGGTYFVLSEAKKLGKKIITVPARHHKSTQ